MTTNYSGLLGSLIYLLLVLDAFLYFTHFVCLALIALLSLYFLTPVFLVSDNQPGRMSQRAVSLNPAEIKL